MVLEVEEPSRLAGAGRVASNAVDRIGDELFTIVHETETESELSR